MVTNLPKSFTALLEAAGPEFTTRINSSPQAYFYQTEGGNICRTPQESGTEAGPFGLLFIVNQDGGGIERVRDPSRPKEFAGWMPPLGYEVAAFEAAKPVKPFVVEVDRE